MPTTHNMTRAGLGILADNQNIYADSVDYYADGSIVMRDTVGGHVLKCNSTEVKCNSLEQLCTDRLLKIHNKTSSGLGVKCNDKTIKCNSRAIDCIGAIIFKKVEYS
jgi:hypothetical protein